MNNLSIPINYLSTDVVVWRGVVAATKGKFPGYPLKTLNLPRSGFAEDTPSGCWRPPKTGSRGAVAPRKPQPTQRKIVSLPLQKSFSTSPPRRKSPCDSYVYGNFTINPWWYQLNSMSSYSLGHSRPS